MRLVAEGDSAAFEGLVARYEAGMLAYFRRAVRDAHSVEDLAAETFLGLFRSRGTYRPDRPFRPYLYSIARRRLIDFLSRAGRERAEFGATTSSEEAPDEGVESPPEATDRAERVARLHRELAELPDHYREAVTLCYLDGLRPSEAAEVIEVPPATVRSRLARGLGILRDRLRAE